MVYGMNFTLPFYLFELWIFVSTTLLRRFFLFFFCFQCFSWNSCWCCCYLWHSIRWINDRFNYHFLEYIGCLYRLNLSKYIVFGSNNINSAAQKHTNFVHLIKLDLAFDLITYSFKFLPFSLDFFSSFHFISSCSHSLALTHLIIWFIWTMSSI